MIYEYLFYKSRQLAKKSGNFDDTPILGGLWGNAGWFMFNIFALIFLIEGLFKGKFAYDAICNTAKYFFVAIFLLILFGYFKYKDRWKKIVSKYDAKEKLMKRKIHPILTLLPYFLLSAIALSLPQCIGTAMAYLVR